MFALVLAWIDWTLPEFLAISILIKANCPPPSSWPGPKDWQWFFRSITLAHFLPTGFPVFGKDHVWAEHQWRSRILHRSLSQCAVIDMTSINEWFQSSMMPLTCLTAFCLPCSEFSLVTVAYMLDRPLTYVEDTVHLLGTSLVAFLNSVNDRRWLSFRRSINWPWET